jgi:hypothetical protein
VSSAGFARYLAGLDDSALVELLGARADVCIEPVPRGFAQLEQRLGGPDSLAAALRVLTLDLHTVGQMSAVLGDGATVSGIASLLAAPESEVRDACGELCRRGMAWFEGDILRLPERLAMHWAAGIGGGRPVAKIAKTVYADDLRVAATALGIQANHLRKPELIESIAEAMSDHRRIAKVIAALPAGARRELNALRGFDEGIYFTSADFHSRRAVAGQLVRAGLLLGGQGSTELPWEVALADWLAKQPLTLPARPQLAEAGAEPSAALRTGQAAASELLRALTRLLDAAAHTPLSALKKGGIGTRERTRLTSRLSIPGEMLVLCIDLASAAGLLGHVESGYAPTDAYPAWREAAPGHRWATVAAAWLALDFAPTHRTVDDDKEQPPPLPLASAAGLMRRAMLTAARPGGSVRAAGREIDWFCPLHGYPEAERDARVAAAVREAELLGVAGEDRICELGEQLLAAPSSAEEDQVARLGERCAPLLPEAACSVILQSDLTAVVSGEPGASVSRLLAVAAVSEARGAASVWRFSPASVRGALDAGWQAPELLAELAALSDRAVPQPLEYLINDTARRHGAIRVRGMRSCLTAEPGLVTELLHTKALARLQFGQLAPTVLSSPFDLDEVLAKVRAAGFAPVAEDSSGSVIVEAHAEHQAAGPARYSVPGRSRVAAAELARRLRTAPTAGSDGVVDSDTVELLAQLNPRLNSAELLLLADAIEHQHDVQITYRNKSGNRTVRAIQPLQLYGRWVESWCHLRDAEREFTVANIESVGPY